MPETTPEPHPAVTTASDQPPAVEFDHVTFAFIGGGFAGLVTGARLKEAGVDDVRIIDAHRERRTIRGERLTEVVGADEAGAGGNAVQLAEDREVRCPCRQSAIADLDASGIYEVQQCARGEVRSAVIGGAEGSCIEPAEQDPAASDA